MVGGTAAGRKARHGMGAESSHPIHKQKAARANWEWHRFLRPPHPPIWHTSSQSDTHSSKSVTPPNPLETVSLSGDEGFTCMGLWGPFCLKPSQFQGSLVQVWQPAVSKLPKALDREASHHWLTSPVPIQRGIVGFLVSTLRENKERGGRTSDVWTRPSIIRQQRRCGCQCTQSSSHRVSSPHCCWVFTYTYEIEVVKQDANWNLLYFYPHSLVPPRPGREVIHIHAWSQRGRELILYFWLKAEVLHPCMKSERQKTLPLPMHARCHPWRKRGSVRW